MYPSGGAHPHHHHHHHHHHHGYGWQGGTSGGPWSDPGWDYPNDDDDDSELNPAHSGDAYYGRGSSGPLSELEEMEFASELTDVASEAELEEFLGDLIKTVAKTAGGLVTGPVGQALTGALKSVAKQALPIVGGALGSMVAPGAGTAIGSQLGSLASGMFEIEGEGPSVSAPDLAAAQRFVQLASQAAHTAALAPPDIPPHVVAREAVAAAAERAGLGSPPSVHGSPGFSPMSGDPSHGWGESPDFHHHGEHHGFHHYGEPHEYHHQDEPHEHHHYGSGHGESGHWVRRGRKVILYGV
jgi:hypothetical protein